MTDLWHPFPENTTIWDRVFRANIEFPLDGMPSIQGHMTRVYAVGIKNVQEPAPIMLNKTLEELLTDPATAPHAQAILEHMVPMLKILWEREAFIVDAEVIPDPPSLSDAAPE